MTRPARSRSRDLLQSLLTVGELAAPDICHALRLDVTDVDQLVAGTTTMSIANQLAFAKLLIERVPRLARAAQSLRNQALAAQAYGDGAIISHSSQPTNWSALKTRRV
jgi:hypothetical protein